MKQVVDNEPAKSSNNNVPSSCSQIGQVITQFDLAVQESSKPERLESIIDNYAELNNKQQPAVVLTPKQVSDGVMSFNDAGNQGVGLDLDGEDSSDFLSGKNRAKFFAFMRTSTAPKIGMQQLEVPDISDSEMPPYRRMDQIISNLTPLQDRSHGLTSLLDGNLPAESEKLLADMEPKLIPIPKKRKTVSFADEEMTKKSHVATTNPDTPSRYRTRASANQGNKFNTNNVVCTKGNPVAKRAVLNAQVAPRSSPRKHPSPTDCAKIRMKRTSKLNIQANNAIDLEMQDVQQKQTSSGDDVVHA
jgi:hypothetical protein